MLFFSILCSAPLSCLYVFDYLNNLIPVEKWCDKSRLQLQSALLTFLAFSSLPFYLTPENHDTSLSVLFLAHTFLIFSVTVQFLILDFGVFTYWISTSILFYKLSKWQSKGGIFLLFWAKIFAEMGFWGIIKNWTFLLRWICERRVGLIEAWMWEREWCLLLWMLQEIYQEVPLSGH